MHRYRHAISTNVLLTVAELFGANTGLGHFMQYCANFADYRKMVASDLSIPTPQGHFLRGAYAGMTLN